jgi:hypothetical protein
MFWTGRVFIMKPELSLQIPNKPKIISPLEGSLIGVLCVVAILNCLANLSLTQDATTYITAANNFIRSGHLYYFVNTTNLDPGLMPYVSQPPGFPLLLVPFIAVFRDPMVSALISQSVYIILFYFAIYWMTFKLKFSPLLRIVTLILFTYTWHFQNIRNTYWTETLFIALSILAGCLAIEILADPGRKRNWIFFLVVLALSTSVKYIGVANLAWIAPLLLKKDVLRAAWLLFTHRNTFRAISTLGASLLACSFLVDLLPVAESGIGPMQWRGIILGSAGLLIGLAGLLYLRSRGKKKSSEDTVSREHLPKIDASTWALFSLFAAAAPVLVWFIRNKLFFNVVYKQFNPGSGLIPAIDLSRIAVPFQYIWNDLLVLHIIPVPLVAILALGLLVLPLFHLPVVGMAGPRKVAQVVILSVAVSQFTLMWFLSFVTKTENIGARYFSPVFALLILGILNGLQQIGESVRPRLWRQLLLAVPLVFLALSPEFSLTGMFQNMGRINYPVERQLWSEIDKISWTQSSSFFLSDEGYSAGGFRHQVFSGKPQGILNDVNMLRNPETVHDILSHGVHPFILVIANGPHAQILDEIVAGRAILLEKLSFPDEGFVLYYLDN